MIDAFSFEPSTPAYSQWAATQAVGAPSEDPDQDGLSNLLELAFGTSPNLPSAEPRSYVHEDGRVSWPDMTNQAFSCTVEASTDLIAWYPADVSTTNAGFPVGTPVAGTRPGTPPHGEKSVYFRLTVALP